MGSQCHLSDIVSLISTINSKSQPSAIYRHSAQLTTDGDNKYWLCKYCHVSDHRNTPLFASESTTIIIYHLKHQHRLEEFGYKAAECNPFSIAKGATNLTSYLGGRRLVFNDLQFKDDFADWVIDIDLTFRQATHQRTYEIFTNHLEDSDKILPKSRQLLVAGSKRNGLAMLGDVFGWGKAPSHHKQDSRRMCGHLKKGQTI